MAPQRTIQPAVPPKATELAARYNLGALLDQRSNGNPLARSLLFLVTGVAAWGLVYLMVLPGIRFIAWFTIVPIAYGIVAPIFAVRMLVRGFEQVYLHQGGLVYLKNGKARAATWAEVAGVEVRTIGEKSMFRGKISDFLVTLHRGAPMRIGSIDMVLKDGERDQLGDRLIQMIHAAGKPVTQRVVHGR